MNIQIFDGIDWTELADDGVKFGGHEYRYEFSTQAPWYITNEIIHTDLDIASVREICKKQDRSSSQNTADPLKPTAGTPDNHITIPKIKTKMDV
jgi:hypothetical protein